MPGVRTERVQMSAAEQAKLDRRVARALQQGRSVSSLARAMKVSETRIRAIAEQFGVGIATGVRR